MKLINIDFETYSSLRTELNEFMVICNSYSHTPTKNDFDDVIKKLKSDGFTSADENGINRLTIKNVFLDKNTGTFRTSNVRTEIYGLSQIQKYCKSNSIKEIYNKNSRLVSFVNKIPVFIDKKKLFPVNFDDFNFRVSYQIEEDITLSSKNFIIQNCAMTNFIIFII